MNKVSTFENAKASISFRLTAGVQRRKGRLDIIWLTFVFLPTLLELLIVGPGPKQVIKMDIGIKFSGTSALNLT